MTRTPRVLNRSRLLDHGELELRTVLLDLVEEALKALSPAAGLARAVEVTDGFLQVAGRSYELDDFDSVVVLGAGKASLELATGLEELLGDRLSGGIVAVPQYPECRPKRFRVIEAGHPIPDAASTQAATAMLELAKGLGRDDLALCVFTGGSSALASLAPPDVPQSDKVVLHRMLLSSGVPIEEVNAVRKHVSAFKGGRLARAIAPAKIVNLSVSDVVGDPLDCITDPTVPDHSTTADALSVLEDHGLIDDVPRTVREHLSAKAADSPDLSDLDIETVLAVTGEDGAKAVAASAVRRGLACIRLGGLLEGEASTVGRVLATMARESRKEAGPWPRGCVVVACGGECTVTLEKDTGEHFGQGGPSQEAALGATLALEGGTGVAAVFVDTDGSDGGTEQAGALVDGTTGTRARELGLSLRRVLAEHRSSAALEALGDNLKTGFTGTNANDLVLVMIS